MNSVSAADALLTQMRGAKADSDAPGSTGFASSNAGGALMSATLVAPCGSGSAIFAAISAASAASAAGDDAMGASINVSTYLSVSPKRWL